MFKKNLRLQSLTENNATKPPHLELQKLASMKITEIIRRISFRINNRVVHLPHANKIRKGGVLFSYITYPFLTQNGCNLATHTNYWEACKMAMEFQKRGYDVDVIDFDNAAFVPRKPYAFVLDAHANLERLAPLLPQHCKKILFLTTSHWSFNNLAEEARLRDVEKRRGVHFPSERMLLPTKSEHFADYILYLGNSFTFSTYNLLTTKAYNIPISTTFTFLNPNKNWTTARRGFVWIGGAGVIHKGVDLLVESFAKEPSLTLQLCGKYESTLFAKVYETELAKPNIIQHGTVDLGSVQFENIRLTNTFVISTSCAEGQSGAVIVGMHAGLIPIVSKECGINTEDFGFTLPDCSIESITKIIKECAEMPASELAIRAEKSWAYAQKHHTRELFSTTFATFVDTLEAERI